MAKVGQQRDSPSSSRSELIGGVASVVAYLEVEQLALWLSVDKRYVGHGA
jgi:sporulation-control protein spo0M